MTANKPIAAIRMCSNAPPSMVVTLSAERLSNTNIFASLSWPSFPPACSLAERSVTIQLTTGAYAPPAQACMHTFVAGLMNSPKYQSGITAGQCAPLACTLEATAPKPGNVHRGADFEDLSYPDLILSAVAIGPEMNLASQQPLGQTVLASIQATQRLV